MVSPSRRGHAAGVRGDGRPAGQRHLRPPRPPGSGRRSVRGRGRGRRHVRARPLAPGWAWGESALKQICSLVYRVNCR